ncbi:MAG: hypothetical protein GTN62_08265 [Gemmatimonadales bacterium]|nr:hypothetical protein [Gemmatimonadales bacterium]NIN50094.1 hypothetical protein [Gemmatimonadales bacterium]NIP07558.1 hypothetical protein [Gemmatimonadales bacterium]NIR01714.1 hypothetical protein [Gemmatimonadales bacterium]NIS65617.1 hypothetical protein [Gemmatimonadales bacterium]
MQTMRAFIMRLFPVVAVVAGIAVTTAARTDVPASVWGITVQDTTCEDMELRVAALNALLQMDAERAMPLLRQVLDRRDRCSARLRRKAVFVVAQQHSDETVDLLLRVARTDPESDVRRQAIFWLSQVSGEEAVAALDSILLQSEDRAVQERAIFALAQHESPRADGILRDFVERVAAPEELREKAIFWLGNRGSSEDQEYLRELYGRLESERLKEKIIFSASQSAAVGGTDWLLDLARNPNESAGLRKKAIFWAAQREEFMVAGLRAVYDDMAEPELKKQVIFALSQRHESEAVDELMQIARTESDPDLRRRAIFWLGQSKDPRVTDFLLEIINR